MANEIGSVGYGLELNAVDTGLVRVLKQVENSMNALDKSVNSLSSKMDTAFKNIDQGSAKASRSAASSMKRVNQAITPTIATMDRLQDKYEQVSNSSSKIGDATGNIERVQKAFQSYQQQVQQGFSSTEKMTAATAQLNREMTRAEQENNKYERSMLMIQRSIGSAERQVGALKTRLQSMDDSEQPINELSQALSRYRNEMTNAAGDSQKTVAAQERFKNAISSVENSVKQGRGGLNNYQQEFRNLADAAILTYGPLGQVATRITTFARLVRNNTLAIGSFTAALVTMGVSLSRSVTAGMEFERQMLGMEAVLQSTGRASEISAQQLNTLAESIAETTLSSTTLTRQAATVLTTYGNIAVSSYQAILEAAQGASSVMGGSIVESVRRFARALEDPANNLGSLTEVGITFDQSQRDLITTLQRTGQVAAAQGVVMERLAVFQELAKGEAQGLAGAYDTLMERLQRMYEALSSNADINSVLADGVNAAADMVLFLSENLNTLEPFLETMRLAVRGIATTLEILRGNLGIITTLLSAAFIGVLIKSIATMATFTLRMSGATAAGALFQTQITAMTTAVNAKIAAVTGLSRVLAVLGTAMNAVLGFLPLIIAGVVAIYTKMNTAASSASSYEEGLRLMGLASDEAATKQSNLASTVAMTNDQILQTQRQSAEKMRENYEKSLGGLEEKVNDIFSSIRDNADTIMFSGESEASIQRIISSLDGLSSEFVNTVKEMASGSEDLSKDTLVGLLDSIENVGGAIDESAKNDFIAYVNGLIAMGEEAEDADQKIGTLADNVVKYGRAIDASALLRGAQEEFQDFFMDIGQTAENEIFRTTAALARIGNVAEEAMAPQFESMRQQLRQSFDQGIISVEEYNRRLSALLIDQDEAVASFKNMGQTFQEMKAEDFSSEVEAIGREIQLLSATSEEARNALQDSFDQEDMINPLIKLMEDLEKSQIDVTIAAVAFSSIPGVNPDAINSYEDLKAAMESAVATITSLRREESNTKRSSRSSSKSTEKSLDSLISKYKELSDVMEQQSRLASGGVEGVLDLQKLQEEEKAVRDVQKALKELSASELKKFAQQAGVTTKAGESVADAMVRMTRESIRFQNTLKEQEEANKKVDTSFKGLIEEYEEARVGLESLTDGIKAQEKALDNLRISRAVDEITESFNKLNPVDQARQLGVLSEAFGLVGVTAENLPQKLTGAMQSITRIKQETARQMELARAAEEESRRMIEAYKTGMEDIEKVIKDSLSNIEGGFSSFASNLLDSFRKMLADLAYEAFLRPIVVGFQSDMSGMLSGQGGGFGKTIDSAKNIFSNGNKAFNLLNGGSKVANAGSLAMKGGLSSAALTSASQVAGGAAYGGWAGSAVSGAALGNSVSTGIVSSITSGISTAMPWVAGAFAVDGLLGGAISKGVSSLIGGLFGSETKPRLNISTYDTKASFSHDSVAESRLGVVGFGKGTRRSDEMFGSVENEREWLKSVAALDDVLASASQSETQLNEMKRAIQGVHLSAGDAASANDMLIQRTAAAARVIDEDYVNAMIASGTTTEELTNSIVMAVQSSNMLSASTEHLSLMFDSSAEGALKAAGDLAQMVGGIENLSSLQSSYYENFYTEAEKAAHLQEDVTKALSAVNIALPETREAFRSLVEAQNLNTEAGQHAYATLLNVQDSFVKFTPAAQEAEKAIKDFSEAIKTQKSLEEELLGLQGNTEELRRREIEQLNQIVGAEEYGLEALQRRIWALEDASIVEERAAEAANALRQRLEDFLAVAESDAQKALSRLQASISSQQESLQNSYQSQVESVNKAFSDQQSLFREQLSKTNNSISSLKSIVSTLQSALTNVRVESDAMDRQRLQSARNELSRLSRTGGATSEQLEGPLKAVQQDSIGFYSTFAEYAVDQAKTAQDISKLKAETEKQLSVEEKTLLSIEKDMERSEIQNQQMLAQMERDHQLELKKLEDDLANYQMQFDALMGIDNSVLSVKDAITEVVNALDNLQRTQTYVSSNAGTTGSGGQKFTNKQIRDSVNEINQNTAGGWDAKDRAVADAAIKNGVSSAQLAASLGKSQEFVLKRAAELGLPSFSIGGFTGVGGKDDPAGIVHKGEYVIPKWMIKQMGGTSAIKALDSMRNGYSNGGAVGLISSNARESNSSSEDSRIVEELYLIRQSLEESKEISYETLVYILKAAKLLDQWDGDGLPEEREPFDV